MASKTTLPLAAGLCAAGLALPASAHISLELATPKTHNSRYGDGELKDGPCGRANGARSANVYTYAPPFGNPTFLTSATTGSDGVFRVLLPLNAPGQAYLVEVPGVLTTSMSLTIDRPTRVLSWFGCTP